MDKTLMDRIIDYYAYKTVMGDDETFETDAEDMDDEDGDDE